MTIRQHAAAAAALALLLAPLALFAQETKKLTDSSVPATVSVADADYLYVVQGGVSKRGTAGQLRAVTDTHVANDLTIESSATIGTDACVRIGDRDAATNAVQICRSSADDRLYHDTDADGTKDTGEEFIDQVGGGAGATGYSPETAPSSCAICDEFTGNTPEQTWTCAGNADATLSYVLDSMRVVVTGDSTAVDRYICTTAAPGSGDWVLTAKVHSSFVGGIAMCGLVVLHAGTQAAPTNLSQLIVYSATSSQTVVAQSATSLTGATSNIGAANDYHLDIGAGATTYLQLRYDDTADELEFCGSYDGFLFGQNCVSRTSVTAATYFGILADDLYSGGGVVSADCVFEFIRLRNDATGTTDPYPAGG